MANKWSEAHGQMTLNFEEISDQFREQAAPECVIEQNANLSKEALGKKKNDSVSWTKYLVDEDDTDDPTPLVEAVEPPAKVMKESRGHATVYQYGTQIPWTGLLETFNKFDTKDRVQALLLQDQVETKEKLVNAEFKKAMYTAVITGTGRSNVSFTTNGVISGTGTHFLTESIILALVNYAKTKRIPKIGGIKGHYRLITTNEHTANLAEDMLSILQYTTPESVLNGELGMVHKTRVIEENFLLGNTVTSEYQGYFFGDDAITSLPAIPPYIMYDKSKFELTPALAWFMIQAYAKTWDLDDDDEFEVGNDNIKGVERIIRIGSKAA